MSADSEKMTAVLVDGVEVAQLETNSPIAAMRVSFERRLRISRLAQVQFECGSLAGRVLPAPRWALV